MYDCGQFRFTLFGQVYKSNFLSSRTIHVCTYAIGCDKYFLKNISDSKIHFLGKAK